MASQSLQAVTEYSWSGMSVTVIAWQEAGVGVLTDAALLARGVATESVLATEPGRNRSLFCYRGKGG